MQADHDHVDPKLFAYLRSSRRLLFRQLGRRYGWASACRKVWRKNFWRPHSRHIVSRYARKGFGVDVGVGYYTISPVERTILTDAFAAHGQDTSLAQLYCRADAMPFSDGSMSFVISEHALEHFANPIKALKEWQRILRPDGHVILFLPHKARTFDRDRPRTKLDHLIADYTGNVGDDDPTHLPEWRDLVVDPGLVPHYQSVPIEDHVRLGIIHHHVWLPDDIVELFRYLDRRTVHLENEIPDRRDSFCVVASMGRD